jgi:hypothetical protein
VAAIRVKIGAAIFKFLTGTGIEASYHEEIYRMTIIDGLTGAHNKRYFLEFLEREIARCARYRRPLSLLMFDIDHFKLINDSTATSPARSPSSARSSRRDPCDRSLW